MRVAPSGDIDVVDYAHNRIVILDSTGAVKGYLGNWSTSSAKNSHFYLTDVDFDASGNTYVSSFGDAKVVKYNSSGQEVYY